MQKKRGVIIIIAAVAVIAIVALLVIPGVVRSGNYNTAVQLAEHGIYGEATEKFAELNDYKDSGMYMDYCLMQTAIETKDWAKALDRSVKIAGFKDADRWQSYVKAQQLFEAGQLEEAITTLRGTELLPQSDALLETIAGQYSDTRCAEIESALERGDPDSGLVIANQALLYAETEKLTAYRAQCAEQICERDYNEAMRLIRTGEFDGSLALLKTLNGYADSADYIDHLSGNSEGRAYAQALQTDSDEPHVLAAAFRRAGDYRDAATRTEEYQAAADKADYETALALMRDNKFSEAQLYFKNLGGYEDSAVYVYICIDAQNAEKYRQATQCFENGDFTTARSIFTGLGQYADSVVKVAECTGRINEELYRTALQYLDAGRYRSAADIFTELGDYKASSLMLKYVNDMLQKGSQQ